MNDLDASFQKEATAHVLCDEIKFEITAGPKVDEILVFVVCLQHQFSLSSHYHGVNRENGNKMVPT